MNQHDSAQRSVRPDSRATSGRGKEGVESLLRTAIQAMKAYTPILPYEVLSQHLGIPVEQIIKLDANENPYGPLPAALDALARLGRDASIYPDPESRALRAALASYTGVPAENLLCGAGADELIDLIMRAFLEPGDAILDCPPTFSMYAFDAQIAGARVIRAARRPDFSLDMPAIEAALDREEKVKLIFLSSPNNPDGGLIARADLERLLARERLVVVLDEAYIDFAGIPGYIDMTLDHENLIVLRTFSKAAALAGLRLGYGAFHRTLITHFWKLKQPYNVNVAADLAARASISHRAEMGARIETIIAERERMSAALAALPYLHPYPSHSNFLLCRVSGIEAQDLKQRLAQSYGILVRYFDKPGLTNHLRITAGRPEHTDALIRALKEIGASYGIA